MKRIKSGNEQYESEKKHMKMTTLKETKDAANTDRLCCYEAGD